MGSDYPGALLPEIRTCGGTILGVFRANKHEVFVALISSNRKDMIVLELLQSNGEFKIWNFKIYPDLKFHPLPEIVNNWLTELIKENSLQDVKISDLLPWNPILWVIHNLILIGVNRCNHLLQEMKTKSLNGLQKLAGYIDDHNPASMFPSVVIKLKDDFINALEIADNTERRMLELSENQLLVVSVGLDPDLNALKTDIIKWTFKSFSSLKELDKTQMFLEELILLCNRFSNNLVTTKPLEHFWGTGTSASMNPEP